MNLPGGTVRSAGGIKGYENGGDNYTGCSETCALARRLHFSKLNLWETVSEMTSWRLGKWRAVHRSLLERGSALCRVSVWLVGILWFSVCYGQTPDSPAKRQLDFALGLFQRGEYQAAVPEFNLYLRNPDWKEKRDIAEFFLGESHRLQNQSSEAALAYEALLASGATGEYRPLSAYRLSKIRLDEGRFDQVVSLLLPLADQVLPAEFREGVLYTLGLAHSGLGKPREAVEWWEKFRKEYPKSPNARSALLGIALEETRIPDCEKAIKHFEEWLSAESASKESAYVQALSELARCEEKIDRKDAARGHYLKLADASEGAARETALLQSARLAFESEDWKAIDQLSPRMKKDLNDPISRLRWFLLEGNRWYRTKDWKKALQVYGEASEVAQSAALKEVSGEVPFRAQIEVRRAWCAQALQDSKAVLGYLDKAVQFGAQGGEINFLRGEGFRGLGDWKAAVDAFALVPDDSPYKQRAQRGEAEAAFRDNQWERCRNQLDRIIKESLSLNDRISWWLRGGDCDRQLGQWASAAIYYASASQASATPEVRERALYLQGWCLLRGEDFARAAEGLLSFSKDFPQSEKLPEVLLLTGQALGKVGNIKGQIEALEKLAHDFPKSSWNADGLLLLVSAYTKDGNREGVLASLLRYRQNFPSNKLQKEYGLWMIDALVQSGSTEIALDVIHSLHGDNLPDEEKENFLFLSGHCHEKAGRWSAALEEYKKLLTQFPQGKKVFPSHVGAGRAYEKMGQIADASKEVVAAFSALQAGKMDQPAYEAQLYLLQGDVEFDSGSYEEAYRAYARTSILYRHPELTPLALEKSALCKEKLGDTQAAEKLREQLKKEYPSSVPAQVESP